MTATASGTSKSQLVSELAKQQNKKFARFREDAETSDVKTFFFLFLNLNMARGNSTHGEFAYIWRSKWVGIIVMKVAGFILEIDQWGSNGLPSVILGGPFSRKGVPQKVFELIVTDCSMRKRTFIEIIIYRLASTEHQVKKTLML